MLGGMNLIIQEILNEAIENIFPEDSNEINAIKVSSKTSEIERKLSDTSGISSGFEDSFSKIEFENEMIPSTPKNETIESCDEYFNDTIDEAIDKYKFEENFKETSVQTSPAGIDKACQCDLINIRDQEPNKKLEIKDPIHYENFNRATEPEIQKEDIHFERMEICERPFFYPKQRPRLRLGLSKRARLQPLHT